jgi:hypothetical protein
MARKAEEASKFDFHPRVSKNSTLIDHQRLQNEQIKAKRALTPGFSDLCIQDSELRVEEEEEQSLKPNLTQINL